MGLSLLPNCGEFGTEHRAREGLDSPLITVVMEVGVDVAERLEFFWISHLANRFLYICCLLTAALTRFCQDRLAGEICSYVALKPYFISMYRMM